MSNGETVGLILGVGALGAGAWWFLIHKPAQVAVSVPAAPPYNPYSAIMKPTPPGAPPPAPSAVSQLMSGVNGLNQAGCQAAAAKLGATGSLVSAGCADFLKYATPLGIAQYANTEVQKIPVVGTAISKVESGAAQIVNAPLNAGKKVVSSILSIF